MSFYAGLGMFSRYPMVGIGPGNFVAYRVKNLDGIPLEAHNLAGQIMVNKITLRLNKEATPRMILDENPDCVIVASGSKQNIPPIPGIDNPNVVMAIDVLLDKTEPGENVAVIGGGLIGVDIAEYLNQRKKKVTLLTRQSKVGADIGNSLRWVTMARIKKSNIKILNKITYQEIKKDSVVIEKNGEKMIIPADTVVIAGGLLPDNELIKAIKDKIPTQAVGDCIEPRKIEDAIHEGFKAALNI